MNISPRKTINVADNHMKKVFSILHTRKCKPKPSWIQLNMHKESLIKKLGGSNKC